jgi:hypothetical protein
MISYCNSINYEKLEAVPDDTRDTNVRECWFLREEYSNNKNKIKITGIIIQFPLFRFSYLIFSTLLLSSCIAQCTSSQQFKLRQHHQEHKIVLKHQIINKKSIYTYQVIV